MQLLIAALLLHLSLLNLCWCPSVFGKSQNFYNAETGLSQAEQEPIMLAQAGSQINPAVVAIKENGKQEILHHDTFKALQDLDKYCKTYWTDPEGHFWLALTLAETGRIQDALNEYEQAVQKQAPFGMDCPELRVNRGNLLFKLQRFAEAERDYRRAIELDPLLYDARLNLAQLLLLQDRLDEAFDQLGECSNACDRDQKFCLLEGLANLKKAQVDQAIFWLEKCQVTSNQSPTTSRTVNPVSMEAHRLLQFLKAPRQAL
jgi:tetratricopeptide (TPR) repeat protein